MREEILKTAREKGLLLENEVVDLLESFNDGKRVSEFLQNLVIFSGQRLITRSMLSKNAEYVQKFVRTLDKEGKESFENVSVKLGISLEITKEKVITPGEESMVELAKKRNSSDYQLFYADTKPDKKIEVADFTGYFRSRYQSLQRILIQRAGNANLVAVNKISSDRQNLSIIGMVTEKRMTKNKNLIISFEDLTGKIQTLTKFDKEEVFKKAQELQLDDIVLVKASGNKDILFIQDIIFPDAIIQDKVKFERDMSIAFISDIHVGSKRHLEKGMQRFLDWIKSGDENARKIRYLFIPGDNVDGVGIFPGQEYALKLKSMKEQYAVLASYLRQIPKDITIFMCPGQHDAVRVAEPQPLIDRRYASELYGIENLVLVTNPTLVKLLEGNKEFKVLMYHGASIHHFINEVPELREMKAHKSPAKAVKHMLKRRHLAPMHGNIVYIPYMDVDPLVINEVPDVLCTGEVHRLDIENYNGVLIITGSCWQAQTDFEEKVGNIPDPCKVPVLNLKTRELKIFDFTDEDELKEVENA
ncbi:MAG: metallophosphoesterase [Nanoarchaeota archaeon]